MNTISAFFKNIKLKIDSALLCSRGIFKSVSKVVSKIFKSKKTKEKERAMIAERINNIIFQHGCVSEDMRHITVDGDSDQELLLKAVMKAEKDADSKSIKLDERSIFIQQWSIKYYKELIAERTKKSNQLYIDVARSVSNVSSVAIVCDVVFLLATGTFSCLAPVLVFMDLIMKTSVAYGSYRGVI